MSAVAMLNGGLGGDGDYRDRTARQKQYAQELEQQVAKPVSQPPPCLGPELQLNRTLKGVPAMQL